MPPTIRNTERIAQAHSVSKIKTDKEWVRALEIYATQHNMQLDDALNEEALHLNRGEPLIRETVAFDTATFIQMKKEELIQQWRNDPNQIKFLENKAKEKNRPFEVVLEQDAQWVIDRKIESGELFQ